MSLSMHKITPDIDNRLVPASHGCDKVTEYRHKWVMWVKAVL